MLLLCSSNIYKLNRLFRILSVVLTMFILSASYNLCKAANYIHDASGRLTAVISSEGQIYQYRYDRAGNLLEIFTEVTAPPATRRGGHIS
jgi:YD repeat-containing protein